MLAPYVDAVRELMASFQDAPVALGDSQDTWAVYQAAAQICKKRVRGKHNSSNQSHVSVILQQMVGEASALCHCLHRQPCPAECLAQDAALSAAAYTASPYKALQVNTSLMYFAAAGGAALAATAPKACCQ